MKKKYTFIDLFAGCGGLSLGLEQAGFEVVFMNEIVETFASTYLANHNLKEGQCFIGDINELNKCLDKYSDILKNPDKPITLVCGGPPCQGFSMANRQRIIDDPRNQLYKAYLQFLSEVRPQFFIMENVKGMANKFDEIIANFKEYLGEETLLFSCITVQPGKTSIIKSPERWRWNPLRMCSVCGAQEPSSNW